jgi:hypothetical protein
MSVTALCHEYAITFLTVTPYTMARTMTLRIALSDMDKPLEIFNLFILQTIEFLLTDSHTDTDHKGLDESKCLTSTKLCRLRRHRHIQYAVSSVSAEECLDMRLS